LPVLSGAREGSAGATVDLFAVVIGGGQATRLQPYSEETPKALMELAPGVTIIDFIVSQLQELGVKDVVVVARPEHCSAFEAHLRGRARVVAVEGDEFGNLHTLEAALEAIGPRRILLTMSDHIFEIDILRRLVEADDGSKQILLCLDAQPDHRDLREGLKVQVSVQGVCHVGKTIPPHSGVDTGLFVLSPDVHESVFILDAEKAGKGTLSDLINHSARKGAVGYVEVTGKLWLDIDTPDDLLKARRLYWEIVRRGLYKPTDGPVSRWLNRPLSTRLSVFLFKHARWATPNLLTVASFLLAIAAASLFVQAQLWVGAFLVHLASVLDGVDGELARLRCSVTAFGSLLDSLLDRLADISLVLALGFLLSPSPFHFGLTGLAIFGVVLVSYVSQLAAQYTDISTLRAGFPWATRDVRLLSTTLGGLALQPTLPLVFCAAAPLLFAARTLAKVMPLRKSSPISTSISTVRPTTPQPSISIPQPTGESHQIRNNVESLLVNVLKAGAILVVLELTRSAVEQTRFGTQLPAPLDISLIFDLIRLVVLTYFGYRVLSSIKFFADIATDLVVTRLQITRGMYARAIADTLYLVIAGLSWWLISPILAKVPEVGSLLNLSVSLAFLGLMMLLLYDLLRILHRGLRWLWDATIAQLTEWLSTHLRPRNGDSGSDH
jgi:choline kinase/phosphatidylglycerophosphate synthase